MSEKRELVLKYRNDVVNGKKLTRSTISELFTSVGDASSYSPIQITEEQTTRSIIVRGKEKDLDVVDKVIREIDVRTKQVLIEAFIVEASSDFERALGTRLGGYYRKNRSGAGGIVGSSTGAQGGDVSSTTAAIGTATDSLTDFSMGATSGRGILKQTGSAV